MIKHSTAHAMCMFAGHVLVHARQHSEIGHFLPIASPKSHTVMVTDGVIDDHDQEMRVSSSPSLVSMWIA